MDYNLGKEHDPSNKVQIKEQNDGKRGNKINPCDFESLRADILRTHLQAHSGEKSNKCNQCDYSSSQTSNLRRHLKTHSGEKSNNCNQCDNGFQISCLQQLQSQNYKLEWSVLTIITPRSMKAIYL